MISDISVGAEHTLALSEDGKVYGWGNNNECQLGLGHNLLSVREPTLIPELVDKNILQVGIACVDSTVRLKFVNEYNFRYRPDELIVPPGPRLP